MIVSVLIPAAGLGERFKRSNPKSSSKLTLSLGGQSLIERTLQPFLECASIREIILAVPPKKVSQYQKQLRKFGAKRLRVVAGGKTRTESVWNALGKVSKKIPWVIVHDGARPLFTAKMLEGFLKILTRKKAVIAAKPVYPTLKLARGTTAVRGQEIQKTISRENLWEAETPQGFQKKILLKAYKQYWKRPYGATDEASLVEMIGVPVSLFKTEGPNLKITEYSDYQVAKRLVEDPSALRFGIGYDIHRLVFGRKLWLGGLQIPYSKGCLGHSDGDPVLHAISDALLGAVSLGDIGEYFSDRSPKTKNMKSSKILAHAYDLVQKKGYRLQNADVNLILERPRLGVLKEKMKKNIAKIMKVSSDRVSIKARTAEGLGAVGSGDAVCAQAIVTVKRSN